MRSEHRIFRGGAWSGPATAQLVFTFGSGVGCDPGLVQQVCSAYPRAHVVGGTTAGEIAGAAVTDGTLVATAVELGSSLETSCSTVAAGFYALGELAPSGLGISELHNQTMTVTTFAEV